MISNPSNLNSESMLSLIETAASRIATQWPISGFVATNPLVGYTTGPFEWGLAIAAGNYGANGLPTEDQIRQMQVDGQIDHDLVGNALQSSIAPAQKVAARNLTENDQVALKYLMAFYGNDGDQLAFPNRHLGFYRASLGLAGLESRSAKRGRLQELPKDAREAIEFMLRGYSTAEQFDILSWVMRRLPGWTGYIKHLSDTQPSALNEYVAFRLSLEWLGGFEHIDTPLPQTLDEHRLAGLEAAEETYRRRLAQQVRFDASELESVSAQLVFCIDVRSEPVRRHLERIGAYETFGFAGFYGLTMCLRDMETGDSTARCPAILSPSFEAVQTSPSAEPIRKSRGLLRKLTKQKFGAGLVSVELAGISEALGHLFKPTSPVCEHDLDQDLSTELPLSQLVDVVEGMLRTIGLTKRFASTIVIVGHGCSTTNNAFGSTLECGACGGHNGEANARLFADFANDFEVREELGRRGISIPQTTRFIAGLHDTTHESIEVLCAFFDEQLSDLVEDLNLATSIVREEKSERWGESRTGAQKAKDWAEVRPEWGLAGNASIVIGNRDATRTMDLGGRSFLHSYDYQSDPTGEILQGIFAGPLTVAHWINACYYFSTVDNAKFGAGSKTTANLLGNFGTFQGAIGDLRFGLPLESVYFDATRLAHYPLRLQCAIVAPIGHVERAMKAHASTWNLVANGWIGLMVMDPETRTVFKFVREQYATGGAFVEFALSAREGQRFGQSVGH